MDRIEEVRPDDYTEGVDGKTMDAARVLLRRNRSPVLLRSLQAGRVQPVLPVGRVHLLRVRRIQCQRASIGGNTHPRRW